MPQTRLLAAMLLALPLVSACKTPYDPYRCKGLLAETCIGYSEVRLAPDIYQVRFEGGSSRALIEDYTLLRSAELTLGSGFSHFIIVRVADETMSEARTSAGTYHGAQTTCSGKGNDKKCVTTPGYWSGGGTYVSTLPGYAYTIQFVHDPSVGEGIIVYDALSIQRDLRRKHDLPFDRLLAYIRRFEDKGLVRLEPVTIGRPAAVRTGAGDG